MNDQQSNEQQLTSIHHHETAALSERPSREENDEEVQPYLDQQQRDMSIETERTPVSDVAPKRTREMSKNFSSCEIDSQEVVAGVPLRQGDTDRKRTLPPLDSSHRQKSRGYEERPGCKGGNGELPGLSSSSMSTSVDGLGGNSSNSFQPTQPPSDSASSTTTSSKTNENTGKASKWATMHIEQKTAEKEKRSVERSAHLNNPNSDYYNTSGDDIFMEDAAVKKKERQVHDMHEERQSSHSLVEKREDHDAGYEEDEEGDEEDTSGRSNSEDHQGSDADDEAGYVTEAEQRKRLQQQQQQHDQQGEMKQERLNPKSCPKSESSSTSTSDEDPEGSSPNDGFYGKNTSETAKSDVTGACSGSIPHSQEHKQNQPQIAVNSEIRLNNDRDNDGDNDQGSDQLPVEPLYLPQNNTRPFKYFVSFKDHDVVGKGESEQTQLHSEEQQQQKNPFLQTQHDPPQTNKQPQSQSQNHLVQHGEQGRKRNFLIQKKSHDRENRHSKRQRKGTNNTSSSSGSSSDSGNVDDKIIMNKTWYTTDRSTMNKSRNNNSNTTNTNENSLRTISNSNDKNSCMEATNKNNNNRSTDNDGQKNSGSDSNNSRDDTATSNALTPSTISGSNTNSSDGNIENSSSGDDTQDDLLLQEQLESLTQALAKFSKLKDKLQMDNESLRQSMEQLFNRFRGKLPTLTTSPLRRSGEQEQKQQQHKLQSFCHSLVAAATNTKATAVTATAVPPGSNIVSSLVPTPTSASNNNTKSGVLNTRENDNNNGIRKGIQHPLKSFCRITDTSSVATMTTTDNTNDTAGNQQLMPLLQHLDEQKQGQVPQIPGDLLTNLLLQLSQYNSKGQPQQPTKDEGQSISNNDSSLQQQLQHLHTMLMSQNNNTQPTSVPAGKMIRSTSEITTEGSLATDSQASIDPKIVWQLLLEKLGIQQQPLHHQSNSQSQDNEKLESAEKQSLP